MARPKKQRYTYLKDKGLYQKKMKDADGKYFSLYGKTEAILAAKVEEAERNIQAALLARANPNFEQYALRWLDLNCGNVSPKTKADYRYIIKRFLVPGLGQFNLREITTDDCKAVLAKLNTMSASVHGKSVMLMKKIFDAAEDSDLIAKNPARKLKRGGVPPEEKVALTAEQQKTLLDAVRGTAAEGFVMLGLHTGMRREEILGLKWDCVFLDGTAPYVVVKRALRWDKNRPVVSENLKSNAARRTIPIPEELVEFLSGEKKKATSEFVIHNTTGGPKTEIQFKNLWRVIESRSTGTRKGTEGGKTVTIEKRLGEKCPRHNFCYTIDFHVTPHILRHTYITELILSGTVIKKVQYLAGHSDPEMTLKTYTHLMENTPEDLIQDVRRTFKRA